MRFKCYLSTASASESVDPARSCLERALIAYRSENTPFHRVRQIHAKIIHHGLSASEILCNPLIDLYSKNGFANTALLIFHQLKFRNKVTWLAMISGLSQNRQERESLHLFRNMHQSGMVPTPYIFSSVINASTNTDFSFGEQLHALVSKSGASLWIVVGNALISLYSRLGSAEKVFEKMHHRDRVSYNSIISGLAETGSGQRVFELFGEMRAGSVDPDPVTVSSLLSYCSLTESVEPGQQLHCYAMKTGMLSKTIVEGSLLECYVKSADMETINNFFTEKNNVVLWNLMLLAYGRAGDFTGSARIFARMQNRAIPPNQFTFPCIVRTITYMGRFDLGEEVHGQVITNGFQDNVYVCSTLIDMYAKCKKLETAEAILRSVREQDVVSWTALITGYTQNDMHIPALKLFIKMQHEGVREDSIGLSGAINACAGVGPQALRQGKQLHARSCVSGHSRDVLVGNSLVNLYARCGFITISYTMFEHLSYKDSISWNGLISGFVQSRSFEEAMRVYARMCRVGVDPNLFTFISAISAAAHTPDIKQGEQIRVRVIKSGYLLEIEAYNALISLYTKCGYVDDGHKLFLEMPERNEVSWNAMITGFSFHGRGSEAIVFFENMRLSGFNPTHITFLGLLSSCSHVGLVEEGLEYFNSMHEEHELEPKPEHYACVVDILGRSGQLNRARKFIDEMPIEPDAMIWMTLLSACRVYKNVELGELAAGRILEMEPRDSAGYVLLSNIYAAVGKWDCRDRMLDIMRSKGIKKEPGQSWIEVKNVIYVFFADDRANPRANEIYDILEDLDHRVMQMEDVMI